MSDAEPSVFAHLTAPGRGGIAVIRCTGPRVAGTLKACFRPVRRGDVPPALGCLAYGHVVDADGRVLDEVILHRAGPATWEVNCHGGPVVVEAVCDRLASLGLVRVDPDALLAAEGAGPVERAARRLLQTAATPLAARILLDQLNGALERAVAQVDDALTAGRPDEAAGALDTLLARWRTCGRYLAEAPRLVIAGRPNVGKSTLLNRLAGHERAITHAEPGTTRDYVETVAAFEGLPVVLVDTAGLREAVGRVEREGVARARRQASAAALVVYLLDVEAGVTADDEAALAHLGMPRGGSPHPPRHSGIASKGAVGAETHRAKHLSAGKVQAERVLAVWNKADLASGPLGPPAALAVSALTGAGLDDLRREGLARLAYRAPSAGAAVPLMREQEERLRCAAGLLADGRCEEAAQRLAALLPHG